MALNKQKMARAFLVQKPGAAGSRNKCLTCAPSAAASNPRRWLLPDTLEMCWLPTKLGETAEQFPPLINKCLSPRATRRHWLSLLPNCAQSLFTSFCGTSKPASHIYSSRCQLSTLGQWRRRTRRQALHHMWARHLTDVQPSQRFCFFKARRTLSAAAAVFLVNVQLVVDGAKQTSARD